ncbi:MAG TPA: tRNA (adenosine(37)-N6)-threonylcarbamoyltransferase complex dimerization subunit type 1 TsaB [Acidimicrobiia bacterium]|jgi:tRNA threonylcarbamoyladenosine biosynthesis protein TsaB
MLVLAIDTSTRQVTVAAGTERGLLGAITIGGPAASGPPRHTETLAPALDELLRTTAISVGDLTAVGVGIGPGMFTGLRAGVVTATVMASALSLPVAPIPSLDAVAAPLGAVTTGLVAAVVDARRAEVYHALYRAESGRLERVTDDAVSRPADAARELLARGEPILLCGDATARLADADGDGAGVQFRRAGHAFDAPSPHALVALTCEAAERDELCAPETVRPRYLRKSDAEINADIRSERSPVASAS